MKSYTHLTLFEREYLEESLKSGKKIRQIAYALGRSPSTISREIKRNFSTKKKRYNAWGADVKYKCRRKSCHRKNNLLYNKEMFFFVYVALLNYWSPEIIAGRWNKLHKEKISFSSIYRAINANLFTNIKPGTHLRRRGKPYAGQRKSYSKHFDHSIHERPEIIESRGRLGDFEGDTVYGSVGKGYLVTAIDRKSRYLVAALAKDKTITNINKAFKKAFSESLVKPLTLTLDNGSEFCGFKDIEEENELDVYFADTHSPWQRGTNENINDVLRFFFPRGTDFTKVSQLYLDTVVALINNRPRKCLGFLSPIEYVNKVLHLA